MLSSLNLGVKTQKYFVSSSNIFLDKKTLLKIWLNPRFNLTILGGTEPWRLWFGFALIILRCSSKKTFRRDQNNVNKFKKSGRVF